MANGTIDLAPINILPDITPKDQPPINKKTTGNRNHDLKYPKKKHKLRVPIFITKPQGANLARPITANSGDQTMTHKRIRGLRQGRSVPTVLPFQTLLFLFFFGLAPVGYAQATVENQAPPFAQTHQPTPLIIPTPPPPPTQKEDPQATKEAELGKTALKANNLPQALLHFAKAHELAPGNLDWLHNAATTALQAGENDQALIYFRQATQLAVAAHNLTDATLYTNEIGKILDTLPSWVDELLSKAGEIPETQASSAQTWGDLREQAMVAAEQGDLELATRLGQQSVEMAKEKFGTHHSATLMSERELATYYTLENKNSEAETLLLQLITAAKKSLGADHPETLAAQTALAEVLAAQFKLPEAIKLHQDAQTAYHAKLGSDHPLSLNNTLALAQLQQDHGDLDQAEQILQQTCPRIAKLYGFYHLETSQCLNQYATLKLTQEQFATAEALYNQSLTIQRGLLADGDPTLFASQIGLAETNRRLGRFPAALALLQPIIATKDPQNGSDIAPLLTEAKIALIHLHTDQGEFNAAENLAQELIAQQSATAGAEHPTTLALLTDLAGIHEKQGRLTKAETGLQQTLVLYKKIFGDAHPTTITTMNNLGQLLEEEGMYDNAEPLLRQALDLARQNIGPDRPLTLTTMNNLALLHESQGNFDKAEPLYKNAIEAYRQRLGANHTDTVAVLNNLAYLYLLQRDYKQAKPLFATILTSWTATLGEGHQRTLKAMNNLARATHHLGEFKAAEAGFTKALKLRRQVLGENHMDVMRSMHDLALLYRDMGRLKEAEELLRQTRAKDEKILGPLHPYTFEALNTLASVLEKTKNPEMFQLKKEIFNRRSDFLDRMLWSTGDNAREGYIRLHTPEYHAYLTTLTQTEPAIAGKEVLETGIRRKGLLLKIASEIRQIIRLGEDPTISATSERLTDARKQLAALTLSGPSQTNADKHLEQLHTLENEVDALQQKLGHASKRLQRTTAKITTDDLVKYLPEKAALVDFLLYKEGDQDKLLAATLRKEHGKAVYDLKVYNDVEAIQQAVIRYRTIIQEEDAEEEDIKQVGQTVYNLIWAPIKPNIGDRETVYVVPDGILNILPFPALVDPDEIYLARSTDLHILSSSRDLIPSDQPRATGNYLIMAGPDYNTDKMTNAHVQALEAAKERRSADMKQNLRAFSSGMRGLHFSPLPGAEKEGRLISNQATDKKKLNTILLQSEAQESVLQSLKTPPEILHIATHGFFLKPDDTLKKRLLKMARSAELQLPPPGDNPLLRAGLAFAGINTNAQFLGELNTNNDGVLTALEVLTLDLTGTQLAVLSACETGLGEIHEGEGVYGLRRAFQEAGAQSVISSLWEVSDAGTQALMTNLYARLGDGMSSHKSLREAQLDLLESSAWSHPYIWSAFMMVGQ